jgi:hypothetical protein
MSYYDRVLPIIKGKNIKGYGVNTYCKIIEYNWNDPDNYRRTFAFGKIMKEWCLTASCRTNNPDFIYIDRVEAYKTCFIDDKPIEDSTAKFVRLALFVMCKMVPTITRFTLKDDSHLYCNGKNNGPKISLAYESILKYNQTWYQYKFGAILDGFLSKTTNINLIESDNNIEHIIIPVFGIDTLFRVLSHSLMANYLKSLLILDRRCDSYDDIIQFCPFIKNYKHEYELANSPRDFISKIREQYTKEEYCLKIKDWLDSYMEYLGVIIYYDAWYIPVNMINAPEKFSEINMSNINVKQKLIGGRSIRNLKNKYHKYNNNTRKRDKGWGITSYRKEINGRAIPWNEV